MREQEYSMTMDGVQLMSLRIYPYLRVDSLFRCAIDFMGWLTGVAMAPDTCLKSESERLSLDQRVPVAVDAQLYPVVSEESITVQSTEGLE